MFFVSRLCQWDLLIKKALLDFDNAGFWKSMSGVKFKNWSLSHTARSSSKAFLCRDEPQWEWVVPLLFVTRLFQLGDIWSASVTSSLSLMAASVNFLPSLSRCLLCSSSRLHSCPRRCLSCRMVVVSSSHWQNTTTAAAVWEQGGLINRLELRKTNNSLGRAVAVFE